MIELCSRHGREEHAVAEHFRLDCCLTQAATVHFRDAPCRALVLNICHTSDAATEHGKPFTCAQSAALASCILPGILPALRTDSKKENMLKGTEQVTKALEVRLLKLAMLPVSKSTLRMSPASSQYISCWPILQIKLHMPQAKEDSMFLMLRQRLSRSPAAGGDFSCLWHLRFYLQYMLAPCLPKRILPLHERSKMLIMRHCKVVERHSSNMYLNC